MVTLFIRALSLGLSANQKLVSFMCGLGLDGVAPPPPSGLAGLSGDAEASEGDTAVPRRGDKGVWEWEGLVTVGVWLVGEVGGTLRCDEEEGNGDGDRDGGVPGEWRAPGDTVKLVGVLRLNRASNSLQTATLRLTPSDQGGVPNPNPAVTSEPLASS